MKKIAIVSLMATMLVALNSCRDEDWNPAPDVNDNIGAVTKLQINPDRTFFNALNPLEDEFVEFTVDVDGFDVTEVSKVEILFTYTENDAVYDPFQEIYVDSVYTAVVVGEVSSFPATVQFTGQQAAEALGKDVADFEVGDSFNLTFPIYSADGRKFTVALASELCNQPGQPSFGGCNVAWAIACTSDLAGNYDYELVDLMFAGSVIDPGPYNGSGTLTASSPGIYRFTDHTFGWWDAIYGAGPGAAAPSLVDVCENLSWAGADEYGDSYSISNVSVSADQLQLTFYWLNTWGEGGTVTLTRTDDKLWPSGLTN